MAILCTLACRSRISTSEADSDPYQLSGSVSRGGARIVCNILTSACCSRRMVQWHPPCVAGRLPASCTAAEPEAAMRPETTEQRAASGGPSQTVMQQRGRMRSHQYDCLGITAYCPLATAPCATR